MPSRLQVISPSKRQNNPVNKEKVQFGTNPLRAKYYSQACPLCNINYDYALTENEPFECSCGANLVFTSLGGSRRYGTHGNFTTGKAHKGLKRVA